MNNNEKQWAGSFGNAYHARNVPDEDGRVGFWSTALSGLDISYDSYFSVFEAGAGKGENLSVIHNSRAKPTLTVGCDINEGACHDMAAAGHVAINASFLGCNVVGAFDLVITRGFLIHVPIEDLAATLDKLYALSSRYILTAEYYSPVRREVTYQGHDGMLWIDDYAGKLLDAYDDLELIDHGFCYGRCGGYDLTYFLLEKKQ